MVYAQSLDVIVRSARAYNLPVALEPVGESERAIVATVFGAALANEISDAGYPGGIEIPLAAEDLYLYPLAELEQRQVGYRIDGRTGKTVDGWDESRYVIADWAANPISVGRDGGLAYAIHGRAEWAYHAIAPDLGCLWAALARWIDYYRGERSGRILDQDFDLLPGITDEVLQRLGTHLPEAESRNLARFLLGTV